jgi:hypothetical protein
MLYSLLPLLPWRGSRVVVAIHEYGFVSPKNTFAYRGGYARARPTGNAWPALPSSMAWWGPWP